MSFEEELKNDVRHEKQVLRFKKSLPFVFFISVFVIVLIFINDTTNRKKINSSQKDTSLFLKAFLLQKNDVKDKISTEMLYNIDQSSGLKELTGLKLSILDVENKKYKEAYESLVLISNNTKYLDTTRYAAMYLICSLALDDKISIENKEFESYVNSFNQTKPFFESSTILKALWFMKNKKMNEAEDTLKLIANSKAGTISSKIAYHMLEYIQLTKTVN